MLLGRHCAFEPGNANVRLLFVRLSAVATAAAAAVAAAAAATAAAQPADAAAHAAAAATAAAVAADAAIAVWNSRYAFYVLLKAAAPA